LSSSLGNVYTHLAVFQDRFILNNVLCAMFDIAQNDIAQNWFLLEGRSSAK